MKILMVTPVPPASQATGSTAVLLRAEIDRLVKRHQVDVVTVAGPDPGEMEAVDMLTRSGIRVHAVLRQEPVGAARWLRRYRLAALWLRGRYPFRTVWFWEPGIQVLIDEAVTHCQPDLILVEDNAMGVYRYPPHIPTIFTEHEVRQARPIDWAARSQGHLLHWALREWDWYRWPAYQRSVWKQFDCIQVFSPRDAAALQSLAPELAERVSINPFGVDVPPTLPQTHEELGTVVFSANFSHPPNVDAALWLGREIMPLLRSLSPGVRLFLVGSQPPPEVIELGAGDIVVTGWVPEIEPYLLRAAVIVAPIRTGGGMRVKVLQGMALGRPVVTTPRGAEGLTTIAPAPPLLIGDDARMIAEAVASLLASTERRRELGAHAHAFAADHLSVAAYVARLEDIWEQLRPDRAMA